MQKVSSFLAQNFVAQFEVKMKTWNTTMSSAILYGCESWFITDLRCVEQPCLTSPNYIVMSYKDVIVITKFVITKFATRRASKAQSIVMY